MSAGNKNRKSEERTRMEEAENAGRFAGNDNDAKSARAQAEENIRQDTTSRPEDRRDADTGAGRDRAQAQDQKGEAQNVNDDSGRPLTSGEAEQARNKATEGMRQKRND